MKTYRPTDYTDRVFERLKNDHPHLTKATIKKVISIYFRNFRKLIFLRKIIHIDRFFKIKPYKKDSYLKLKNKRNNV